ncbi:MAG: hypothetical protein ACRBCT_00640 [Alphaproteobacteria bacterium]
MLRYVFALILLLPTQTLAAQGDKECYTRAEAEAEQGIRIHSELMVIGLNCTHMGAKAGINLYGQYRQFSADHGDLFAQYESIIIDHFKNGGNKNPEKEMNTLRTNFANKISKDAAGMRPDVFCSQYAPRVLNVSSMSHDDIRRWASTFHDSHPVSKPFCQQ